MKKRPPCGGRRAGDAIAGVALFVPYIIGDYGGFVKRFVAKSQDVRKACEKYNIGWAMWDYAGGFAVATGKPGERKPDPDTVKALGLTMPK